MRKLLLPLAFLVSAAFFLYPERYTFEASMALLFLSTFLFATFNDDEGNRARWIFVAIFFLIAGVIASFILADLVNNVQSPVYETIIAMRLVAFLIGAIFSVGITVLFFFLTAFIAGIYVLSVQKIEDVTMWQAFRSFFPLVLNMQYDWMVIADGKVIKTREKGILPIMGGPGKIIIEPGNAVVLQKGGKITRVCGAGIVLTKRHENIREIFDLRNQFKQTTEKDVITADRIPLEIEYGRGFRIAPAEDPDSPTVIKDNLGRFPVEKETLLRAAFNNTPGKWSGLGAGAPVAQLFDQIMSYNLDELFDISEGKKPRPNRRIINQIEQDIMTALNGFAAGKGLVFTMADIRRITMPEKVAEAMTESQAIALVEMQRNEITKDLFGVILDGIREGGVEQIGESEIRQVTAFVEKLRRLEIMREMAKSEGTKIINTGNAPVEHPIEAK